MLPLAWSILLGLTAAPGSADPGAPRLSDGFIRGMTISCPHFGQTWGSPAMEDALSAIDELGVEWVSIHPYASVASDGAITFRPAQDTEFLVRAVQLVRKAKKKLFLKPHLAYWGSRFDWPGAIEFGGDEPAWQRFFAGYRAFVLDQAAFAEAAGIELFAVGVELDRTVARPEWVELVRQVRAVYRGPLTYGANWDAYASVPFWPSLDHLGVQAYFPLSDAKAPPREALVRAFRAHLDRLSRFAAALGKPVLFTEIGYTRSEAAAERPWAAETADSPAARELRRTLMDVALTAAAERRDIHGMFWWKWIPGYAFWERDFSMKDDEARATLRRHWGPR